MQNQKKNNSHDAVINHALQDTLALKARLSKFKTQHKASFIEAAVADFTHEFMDIEALVSLFQEMSRHYITSRFFEGHSKTYQLNTLQDIELINKFLTRIAFIHKQSI